MLCGDLSVLIAVMLFFFVLHVVCEDRMEMETCVGDQCLRTARSLLQSSIRSFNVQQVEEEARLMESHGSLHQKVTTDFQRRHITKDSFATKNNEGFKLSADAQTAFVGYLHPGSIQGNVNGMNAYGTRFAFMVWNKSTGQALCWGDEEYGGNCSHINFTGVTDVHNNELAFMALNKNTGKAECWGDPSYDSLNTPASECSEMDFSGVTDVASNTRAFLAWNKDTGKGQCWGYDCRKCSEMNFTGITDVIPTSGAFLAMNKNAGQGFCCGRETVGGSCPDIDFSGVTDVYATGKAYMVLNKNTGEAACYKVCDQSHWSAMCSSKNLSGVTDVYTTLNSFLALNRNTGRAHFLRDDFDENQGHSCMSWNEKNFSGDTEIIHNQWSYVAFNKKNGQVWWCGISAVLHQNFTGITDIYAGESDFMALNKNTGQAFTWLRFYTYSTPVTDMNWTGVTNVLGIKDSFMSLNQDTGEVQCVGRNANSKGGHCSNLDFAQLAVIPTPAPTPEPTPAPTPAPTPVPTPAPTAPDWDKHFLKSVSYDKCVQYKLNAVSLQECDHKPCGNGQSCQYWKYTGSRKIATSTEGESSSVDRCIRAGGDMCMKCNKDLLRWEYDFATQQLRSLDVLGMCLHATSNDVKTSACGNTSKQKWHFSKNPR